MPTGWFTTCDAELFQVFGLHKNTEKKIYNKLLDMVLENSTIVLNQQGNKRHLFTQQVQACDVAYLYECWKNTVLDQSGGFTK